MRKKTIGEVLRLARTNQGLSIEELSQKTDIQAELLEALENNDYDRLPSPFYARSFLRKYAWAVDLDESIILDAYEAGENIVYDEVELADDEEYRSRKNKRQSSFLPLFYFTLLALAILAFISYYVWTYARSSDFAFRPSESYSLVSETVSNSSSAQSESQDASSSSAASSAADQLTVTGSGDRLEAAFKSGGQPVNVTVSVSDSSSWVSISDSELADGVTLSPEQSSRTVSLASNTVSTITLGRVAGISISVNGQKLDTSALSSDSASIILTIT